MTTGISKYRYTIGDVLFTLNNTIAMDGKTHRLFSMDGVTEIDPNTYPSLAAKLSRGNILTQSSHAMFNLTPTYFKLTDNDYTTYEYDGVWLAYDPEEHRIVLNKNKIINDSEWESISVNINGFSDKPGYYQPQSRLLQAEGKGLCYLIVSGGWNFKIAYLATDSYEPSYWFNWGDLIVDTDNGWDTTTAGFIPNNGPACIATKAGDLFFVTMTNTSPKKMFLNRYEMYGSVESVEISGLTDWKMWVCEGDDEHIQLLHSQELIIIPIATWNDTTTYARYALNDLFGHITGQDYFDEYYLTGFAANSRFGRTAILSRHAYTSKHDAVAIPDFKVVNSSAHYYYVSDAVFMGNALITSTEYEVFLHEFIDGDWHSTTQYESLIDKDSDHRIYGTFALPDEDFVLLQRFTYPDTYNNSFIVRKNKWNPVPYHPNAQLAKVIGDPID